MRFTYPVELEDDETAPERGALLVTFPDLSEAITSGTNRGAALSNAVDCLETALAMRINRRKEIPVPSPARGRSTVAPGHLIAAKAALYLALRESSISQSELARRMGVMPSLVQRLLDPRHSSRADQFDKAFAALGKRVVLSVEDAA